MNTPERHLTIEQLSIGDLVACEKQYMTSAGYYFPVSSGFRVKRKNTKSISLAPLKDIDGSWTEQPVIRIPRTAIIISRGMENPEPPLFMRDNAVLD